MEKIDLTSPVRVADLAAVQNGAVVSQTLMKAKGGNVTLFAFDGGEGLSEHSTPHDVLLLGLDGRATVTVGGVAHGTGAGELLLLPANVPHALQAESPFRMLLILIRAED